MAASAETANADVNARIQEYQRIKAEYISLEEGMEQFCKSADWMDKMEQWMSGSLAQINEMQAKCKESMSRMDQCVAVPSGQYWTPKMLARHCSLMLDEKRLIRTGDADHLPKNKPSWSDVIKLTSTLTNLKTKGFVSKKQVKFLEEVEMHLKEVFFEGRELRRITDALATKLSEEIEQQTITADLTKHEHVIADLLPDLSNCENLLEAAMLNGDMAMAEEISYNQIGLHERLLGIVQEQYPIIRKRQEDSREFKRRRRWAIFRMANRDVASVVELKYRQIEACEEDIQKIKAQVENYSQDDLGQRRRYDLDASESDRFLYENTDRQESLWKKVGQLCSEIKLAQEELSGLASARRKEVNRRAMMREKEEGRRSGHAAFVSVAEQCISNLETTIANAERAKDICLAINDFILDGCDSVALKFDRTERVLSEMANRVNRQYLKQFTDYYLAVGRLKHKKQKKREAIDTTIADNHVRLEIAIDTIDPSAKKHASAKAESLRQRSEVDQELEALTHKLEESSKAFEEVAESLRELNIPFVHPSVILDKSCFDRNNKILEYRDMLNLTEARFDSLLEEEATSIAKEKELHVQKVRAAKQAQRIRQYEPKAPPHPHGDSSSAGHVLSKYQAAAYKRYRNLCDNVLSKPMEGEEPEAPEEDVNEEVVVPGDGPAAAGKQPDAAGDKPNFLPTRLEGRVVVAMCPYRQTSDDELTFNAGDNIVVINEGTEEGWHYGICNQRTGLFPSNFVTLSADELI
eukprot:TRINITY_DN16543_c0_g1_i1.p1 TRINITY_DN16543_c0_g1~~TRINITY_DN16543_c0_g1_i1.p1  ORF type:complete len:751 (+),score=346.96 TRINITY_DN16543_c0_g1_i1:67-2319(+)